MRKQPTIRQKAFADALLDSSSKTHLNGTEAALATYNTTIRSSAATISKENLQSPPVTNYLEQRAEALGIGIQVRLRNYGEIADGQEKRKSVSKRYVRDEKTNRMVLVSKVETVVPTKDSDRIKAMERIDSLTGTKEQREIDKQHAMSEYDDLYKRMVRGRVRALGVSAGVEREVPAQEVEGAGEEEQGEAQASEGAHPQEDTGDPARGGKGSHSSILSSSSVTLDGIPKKGFSLEGVSETGVSEEDVVVRKKEKVLGVVEVDVKDIPADIPSGTVVRKKVDRKGGESGELGFGASDVMKSVLRGDLHG